MNGQGALNTSERPSGQSGMYGHCQWNGKIIWKSAQKIYINILQHNMQYNFGEAKLQWSKIYM